MNSIELLIDNREIKIKEHFKNKDYVTIKNLELGDIIFKYNDDDVLIIERKTLSDLACSIKDGRYNEQKQRLLSNYSKHKILYIIEGNMNKSSDFIVGGLPMYTLFSSIINMLLRDNINIYKSIDIQETIRFIKKFIKKLKKQGTSFLNQKNISYTQTLIKSKKKQNMTPEICYLQQLSQIPGVSYKIAKTISQEYKSMNELIINYNKLETEEQKQNMLMDIKITSKTGKQRRIGKKVSINIYNFLN